MRPILPTSFLLTCLILAGAPLAAEMPEQAPKAAFCPKRPIEFKEHQACQAAEMVNQEGRMAQAYKSLLWSTPSPHKETLLASQATWVKERDTQCAQADLKGPRMATREFLVEDCKIEMTTERADWLQAALILTWTPRGEDKTAPVSR